MASLPDRRLPTTGLPGPRADGPPPDGPFWADGEITLRLREPGSDRVQRIGRPFAVVGRIAGSDVRIDDRAVSARHVYLHLDERGAFGVDLATRTGTRFGEAGHSSGWLRPGQSFEVAGRRIELLEMRLGGRPLDPGPVAADPLADAGGRPLVAVTLHAMHGQHVPRSLGSELVFVGRGPSCGVRVEGATASRVHCVLARTATAAFVIDLIGRGTWLNGRLVADASILRDGDTLAIGSAQFGVRIAPAADRLPTLWQAAGPPDLAAPPGWSPPGPMPPGAPPMPDAFPADAQRALLAWMMGALQAGQAESLRRQGEFHLALTRLIQQMQQDNATLLNEHLDRMERIDRELAGLRAEIYRRFGSAEAASATAAAAQPPAEIPSSLRVAPAPKPPSSDPAAAATWLINRVGQLEEEQRSTWRDMVTRLTGQPR